MQTIHKDLMNCVSMYLKPYEVWCWSLCSKTIHRDLTSTRNQISKALQNKVVHDFKSSSWASFWDQTGLCIGPQWLLNQMFDNRFPCLLSSFDIFVANKHEFSNVNGHHQAYTIRPLDEVNRAFFRFETMYLDQYGLHMPYPEDLIDINTSPLLNDWPIHPYAWCKRLDYYYSMFSMVHVPTLQGLCLPNMFHPQFIVQYSICGLYLRLLYLTSKQPVLVAHLARRLPERTVDRATYVRHQSTNKKYRNDAFYVTEVRYPHPLHTRLWICLLHPSTVKTVENQWLHPDLHQPTFKDNVKTYMLSIKCLQASHVGL